MKRLQQDLKTEQEKNMRNGGELTGILKESSTEPQSTE